MWMGRLQALVMEWAPGEPLMSRDNLDSMRVDNVATPGAPGLEVLGITPSSVHAIAPLYLKRS
jgi:NADH dehydrogenase